MSQRRDSSLLLLFSENKVLLQHRTSDAPRFPNCWNLFGGGIDEGETPMEAIFREIQEELDYSLVDPTLYVTMHFGDEVFFGKKYIFKAHYDDKPLTLLEGQGMGWFTKEEALKLELSPYTRFVIHSL